MKNRIIAALAALAAGALLYLPAIAAAPQPRTASPTVVPAAVHRLAAAADAVTAPPEKCTAAATVPHRQTAHRASAPACRRPGFVTVNKNISAAPSHIVNAMYAGAALVMTEIACLSGGASRTPPPTGRQRLTYTAASARTTGK